MQDKQHKGAESQQRHGRAAAPRAHLSSERWMEKCGASVDSPLSAKVKPPLMSTLTTADTALSYFFVLVIISRQNIRRFVLHVLRAPRNSVYGYFYYSRRRESGQGGRAREYKEYMRGLGECCVL